MEEELCDLKSAHTLEISKLKVVCELLLHAFYVVILGVVYLCSFPFSTCYYLFSSFFFCQ
jgi:hypothetical protein